MIERNDLIPANSDLQPEIEKNSQSPADLENILIMLTELIKWFEDGSQESGKIPSEKAEVWRRLLEKGGKTLVQRKTDMKGL